MPQGRFRGTKRCFKWALERALETTQGHPEKILRESKCCRGSQGNFSGFTWVTGALMDTLTILIGFRGSLEHPQGRLKRVLGYVKGFQDL